MTLRIIIADDHPAVLLGLRTILSQSSKLDVVGEATTPDALLDLLATVPCDIVIADYSMPDQGGETRDGLMLVKKIRWRHPEVRLVVNTMITNVAILQAILQTGAASLLSKADVIEQLPQVLELVSDGHQFIGKGIQLLFATRGIVPNDSRRRLELLSPREAEVVRMLSLGLSIGLVAQKLHRSVKTVSNQKRAAMAKLGLTTDMELFAYAKEQGLS